MNILMRKVNSLYKLLIKNKLTKPKIMGEKILILACAPCVRSFFEYESVRNQFKNYDIAFINFMIVHSEKEMFDIKPKYIMLVDTIFYENVPGWEEQKLQINAVLSRINWPCILVTSVLANFDFTNDFVTIHRISCFEIPYKKFLLPLYKRNIIALGLFNIMQAALYYAVTFGYKTIAVLGCNYQMSTIKVIDSGLKISNYEHYYDTDSVYEYISWDEIESRKNGYVSDMFKRACKSAACFYSLSRYAKEKEAEIINYSDDSALDGFRIGKLEIE